MPADDPDGDEEEDDLELLLIRQPVNVSVRSLFLSFGPYVQMHSIDTSVQPYAYCKLDESNLSVCERKWPLKHGLCPALF